MYTNIKLCIRLHNKGTDERWFWDESAWSGSRIGGDKIRDSSGYSLCGQRGYVQKFDSGYDIQCLK